MSRSSFLEHTGVEAGEMPLGRTKELTESGLAVGEQPSELAMLLCFILAIACMMLDDVKQFDERSVASFVLLHDLWVIARKDEQHLMGKRYAGTISTRTAAEH
jgi:hypothetical protein